MHRRLLVVIVLALATALALAGPVGAHTRYDHTRQATSFFGHAVPPVGTSIENAWLVPDKVLAKKIAVTADTNGVVTATADIETGAGSTLNGTLTWVSSCHWKLAFVADSTATPSTAPTTTVKVNHIEGFIDSVGCEHHAQLTLKGYSLGESTFDVNLSIVKDGFEGSAEVNNLVLGKTTYPRAKVSISTLSTAARIEGEMQSDLGTFTVDAMVTAPHGSYHQDLTVTGADLKVESPSFEFKSFHYHTVFSIPNGGCASYTAQIGGKLKIKNTEYALLGPPEPGAASPTEIRIECGVVKVFKLGVHVHHSSPNGEYVGGTLSIALMNTPGTAKDLTSPGLGSVDGKIGSISYKKGLFGYVDLYKGRAFKEKWKDWKGDRKCFCVNIRLGLVFGVAVYVPSTASEGSSTYHTMIGAGGYFDAGRVDGSFGCVFSHTENADFSCGGKFTVDPAWAGRYTRHWGDI
jgi:hypothetical protein